jgi:hypothetical protein
MTIETRQLAPGTTLTIDWSLVPSDETKLNVDLHRKKGSDLFLFRRPAPTFTPRKWARERVAWAHGARIQSQQHESGPPNYPWLSDENFVDRRFYRIHPEDEPYFDERGFPKGAGE